ncbi:hypothetical protein AAHH67_31270 [Niallia circulans]
MLGNQILPLLGRLLRAEGDKEMLLLLVGNVGINKKDMMIRHIVNKMKLETESYYKL